MIGVDTNVLVRYFIKDDPVQTHAAVKLVQGLSPDKPGWIGLLVLAELAWTLRRLYKLDRVAIAGIIEKLLISTDIVLEARDAVRQALLLYRKSNADFADCVIAVAARVAGCSSIVTFDEIAARDLGMELVK
ncbi:MAG: type II toxin-antitoxin system VapC family toxin [Terracidiphilus sp.]